MDIASLEPPLSAEATWLEQWVEVVHEWSPSREQAQELLSSLAFIIGLVAFGLALASPEGATDEVLTGISLLFAAGALLLRYLSGS